MGSVSSRERGWSVDEGYGGWLVLGEGSKIGDDVGAWDYRTL